MLTNNVQAVVQYVRECESVPQIISNYGGTYRYAISRFNCSPAVASLIRDILETSDKPRLQASRRKS